MSIVHAVSFVALTTALLLMWFKYIPEYRLSTTRDRLFELRFSLRQRFYSSEQKRNNPAFLLVDRLINSHIRFAHRANAVEILTIYLARNRPHVRRSRQRGRESFDQCWRTRNLLPSEDRKFLKETLKEIHLCMLMHVIRGSLILSLVVRAVWLSVFVKLFFQILARNIRGFFAQLGNGVGTIGNHQPTFHALFGNGALGKEVMHLALHIGTRFGRLPRWFKSIDSSLLGSVDEETFLAQKSKLLHQ